MKQKQIYGSTKTESQRDGQKEETDRQTQRHIDSLYIVMFMVFVCCVYLYDLNNQ